MDAPELPRELERQDFGYSFTVNGAEVNVDEERLQRALSALSGGGQGSGALQLLPCGVPERKLQ